VGERYPFVHAEPAHDAVADLRRIAVGLGDARLVVDARGDQCGCVGEQPGRTSF
jgi:hypothetical protein